MGKRSITDADIAMIKALLVRDMKNKDIQFFFNRPDRPVNSGRITGIRDGSYGPSKKIPAASDRELDAFIASHSSGPSASAIGVPVVNDTAETDSLSDGVLEKFFVQGVDGRWRLTLGETDMHECKTSFGLKYPSAWLRAIAALANNTGGYVFFGVHDKGVIGDEGDDMSNVAIGMKTDEFAKMDPAEVTKRVKSVFDPTPRVRAKLLTLGTATVGVIHVERHQSRPVISTKNEGSDVREGDIYFRYPGQSARIKYSDLRTLLDARDRDAREQMLPMVERLLQLGPERSMIADLADGTLGDGKRSIQIDASLIEKLTFIKEGEFSEVVGAPTLRLIGDVQSTGNGETVKTKLGLVTRADVLDAFLDQAKPDDPERYIRFAIEVGQGEWFPLHYFAQLSGMSRAQLVDFINGTVGTTSRKTKYVERVQPNAAFKKAVGKPKAFLERLLSGDIIEVVDGQDASQVAQAIEALPDGFEVDAKRLLLLLKECLHVLEGRPAQSYARRAICRVDELLFAEAAPLT